MTAPISEYQERVESEDDGGGEGEKLKWKWNCNFKIIEAWERLTDPAPDPEETFAHQLLPPYEVFDAKTAKAIPATSRKKVQIA